MPNLLEVILAVIIFAIPLYPKFPLTEVVGSYVNIRLDDVIIATSVFIWIIYQLKNKVKVLKEPILWIFIAYWLALLSSALNSISNHQIEPISILLLHSFRRIEYMLVFFIAFDAIKTKNNLKFPLVFLCLACIGVSIVGLGQKYLSWPIVSTMNEEFSKGQLLYMSVWTRISSTFAGHYDLATFMSVVLVIIGPVALLAKQKLAKIALLVTWLISFYTLTLTASRISIVAFWFSISLALFLIKKKLWIIPTSILIAFSIFNSAELSQRLLATIPSLQKKLAFLQIERIVPTGTPIAVPTQKIVFVPTGNITKPAVQDPTVVQVPTAVPTPSRLRPDDFEYPKVDLDAGVARSGEIRFKVEWPRAINAFLKNPLQGTGSGSITLATDNDFLRILGETGLLGLISFLLIPVWFFVKTIKQKGDTVNHKLNYIFLCCIISMFANAIFIDVFAASKTAYMFWIIMGIYYANLKFTKNA